MTSLLVHQFIVGIYWSLGLKETEESILKKFLAQFYESPLKLPLLGSAAVIVLVGNMDDAICITAAILIVVVVCFVQKQRSEKSLNALNKLNFLAKILVPGDLVAFSVGDQIPANIRLMRANNLEIDKSPMTGETKPIKKQTEKGEIQNRLPDISERTNVALMGTLVRSGNGSGIVVRTGSETEFGVVFGMMQEELAKKLSTISFVVIGVICLIGVLQKRSWLEMFTVGISLAFAAIPKGLPIFVTVTLALGVRRMSKQNAISKLSIMICMPTLL
ncbi:E1-E2 ATPase-domain-containing protein [Phakopsora pachyrhizi]|uniref:E1-E2 ATPase-domain-containing protein n=1 Tax=Phakopsora pachyrhizi TaxID=170000 RepID=A0AAV0ATM3_PHAPC|nr:E1-E2 ATPase-domain-containing protein [Phakopsora pachyrhizi]